MTSTQAIQFCKSWLKNDVLPLWINNGIDAANGSFFESLNFDGVKDLGSRRALVQCRQIYALSEAYKMQLLEKSQVTELISNAVNFLNKYYKKPAGNYVHAVNGQGEVTESQSELYTQAFVLFALARAYELLKTPEIKTTSISLFPATASTGRILRN